MTEIHTRQGQRLAQTPSGPTSLTCTPSSARIPGPRPSPAPGPRPVGPLPAARPGHAPWLTTWAGRVWPAGVSGPHARLGELAPRPALACGVPVVTRISSSGAGWPAWGQAVAGCVSGHHAADAIEAACGMGGDAVLHGRPVRTWAAGPGPVTRYRRGLHPAQRTRPSASLLRWGSPAARCPQA